jgi:hypothetical protein
MKTTLQRLHNRLNIKQAEAKIQNETIYDPDNAREGQTDCSGTERAGTTGRNGMERNAQNGTGWK